MDTVYSDITGLTYHPGDPYSVRIVNPKQQLLYIKHGVPLLDMYVSPREGRDWLIMVFDKAASQACFQLWCKRELR